MADASGAAEQLGPVARVVLEEGRRRIPDCELGPGASDRVQWPAGLIGINSLPLVFPPGGGLVSTGPAYASPA